MLVVEDLQHRLIHASRHGSRKRVLRVARRTARGIETEQVAGHARCEEDHGEGAKVRGPRIDSRADGEPVTGAGCDREPRRIDMTQLRGRPSQDAQCPPLISVAIVQTRGLRCRDHPAS